MHRVTYDCDRCNKKDAVGVSRFSVSISTYCDAAGSSATRECVFDLCPSCQSLILGKVLEKLNFTATAQQEVNDLIGKNIIPS